YPHETRARADPGVSCAQLRDLSPDIEFLVLDADHRLPHALGAAAHRLPARDGWKERDFGAVVQACRVIGHRLVDRRAHAFHLAESCEPGITAPDQPIAQRADGRNPRRDLAFLARATDALTERGEVADGDVHRSV